MKVNGLDELLHARPALLLDFDGLLVDSEPLHFESFRRAFSRFGHVLDRDEYWRHFTYLGEGVEGELARHHLEGIPPEIVKHDKVSIFSALCSAHPPAPRPGASRLLRLLSETAWPHTIASNTDQADVARMLVHLDPPRPMPIVGGDGLRGKPHPDIYLAAAAAVGKSAQACLAVEDTLKGLRAAAAAGMPCIVVPGPQTATFDFPGAALVLETLEPLADAIARVA